MKQYVKPVIEAIAINDIIVTSDDKPNPGCQGAGDSNTN